MGSSTFSGLVVVVLNFFYANAFNLDAFNYAVYGNEDADMFGFTVAVHKQRSNQGWVLVGAPEAQSRYQPPEVVKGGVVYKCRPDGDDQCEEVPFDREGNQRFGNKELDIKKGQWFGATLSTSMNPNGGPVVACAPRYTWYSREMIRRDPVGTCYVSDTSFQHFEEYAPCRTSNWGYHRMGTCQAGFSAAINSIGDRLFMGAPGSYFWQGQMYSIDAHAHFNFTPGLLGTTFGAKGSVHQQSLETRPAVFQTKERRQVDDDSYLGYSTIIGDFLNSGEQGVAVGMPRGAELHGKVLLFTWNLTNYKEFTSNQLGSYFGYALAAADVDGDHKLDLIVGAPMHTEPNTEDKYDVGRVYVFYQDGGFGSFNKTSFIDGINSRARFGHSLAALGDMNQDGFEDFAVGAPYDGPNESGAVYIYYGSFKGVLEKYGQVIYGDAVTTRFGRPVQTFGFSLAGGMDMDGNDYPDMAVGAYLSNTAFFFRSRPVVRVEAFVEFKIESKQIDIRRKNCNLPNGDMGTCTKIDFCVKYTGKGIPRQIRLNVQYILDTKKPNTPRMAFRKGNSNTLDETIDLYKGSEDACKTEEIYIKNDIRDKLTPLEAEVKYSMIQEVYTSASRNPQSALKPILDLNLPPSRKDSIIIQKNCGNDNICIPNLHVNVTKNVDSYFLDSNTNLEFTIIVSNLGEDSFETTLDLVYPDGIYYKKSEVQEDMHGILCSDRGNRTISCDIGNPLPSSRIAKLLMIFVPYHKKGIASTYEFDFYVNSTNPESNSTLQDNHANVKVDIRVDSALDVSGRSIPQEIYISNTSQYTSEKIEKESEIGPQVTHLYTLRNRGPATIYEAEMYFIWPWQTLSGEDLLYILEQPHVPKGVKCDIPAPANYKGYQLDYNPKPIWERLQIDSSSQTVVSKWDHVKVEGGKSVVAEDTSFKQETTNNNYDQEVKQSGDSSVVYEKRHNASQAVSGFDTSGHISKAGETSTTTAEWHTTVVNGQNITQWTNVTIVRDANGKIIRTFYHSNDARPVPSGPRPTPKIIYTSSGGQSSTGEENLSISSQKIHEEQAWTLGGGEREDGSRQSATATAASDNEARIRYEQRIQYEERLRQQQEEQRRKQEQQNFILTQEEERQKNEQRLREEQARRQEEIRRVEQARVAEERARLDAEERRRTTTEDPRLRQQQELLWRQQEERRIQEEIRYREELRRQEEERRRTSTEDSRRRQYEYDLQMRRRQDEEIRRRQQQQRTRTGYFDAQGVYHDESHQINQSRASFGQAAAAGQGFRTQTIDLGMMGQSGQQSGQGGSSQAGQWAGGSSSQSGQQSGHWSMSGSKSSGGTFSGTLEHGVTKHDEYSQEYEREYDDYDVPTSSRTRRQVPEIEQDIVDALPCTATKCIYMKCTVGTLEKDEFVSIALRSRLNVRAVRQLSTTQPIKLSSMMVARISELPYIGKPKDPTLHSHEVFTDVPAGEQELAPQVVPLWIILLSAIAGTLILLLVILLLYKCGFFKRKRPSTAPERQPLRTNGYSHE